MPTLTTRNDARTYLAQTTVWGDLNEAQQEQLTGWLWTNRREILALDSDQIGARIIAATDEIVSE